MLGSLLWGFQSIVTISLRVKLKKQDQYNNKELSNYYIAIN